MFLIGLYIFLLTQYIQTYKYFCFGQNFARTKILLIGVLSTTRERLGMPHRVSFLLVDCGIRDKPFVKNSLFLFLNAS